ncbi:MAG: bifunctional enoyl-CoA hydratase/phosphate acetyltransferase [Pseudomonadota bacterium]
MNDLSKHYIENITFDELTIGQSARQVRTLALEDIQAFAAVSGDLNPTHVDADFARLFQGVTAHGMWGGTLVSSLLGTELPGPGTVYVEQSLQFLLPVHVGDTLTVSATVLAKDAATKRVTLACAASNQHGAQVLSGTAVVLAPLVRIRRLALQLQPMHMFDPQARLRQLLAQVRHLAPVRCAVVHPCDEESLRGALEAAAHGVIEPLLIGPEARLRALAEQGGMDLHGVAIRAALHSVDAAEQAVALAASGQVGAIMKGSLHTDELMHAVMAERALRSGRRLSHVFRFDVPRYDKPLLLTDAALNIRPGLEDKADIVQNAILLAHALGLELPDVAILAAVETVNVHMQSTLDAAALCKMADRGQIRGARLDGPLAFDNAVSMEAARIKGIASDVAGHADILVVPDLESGNMLAKQLEYLAGATTCGVVLGARVPIALTSRADGPDARVGSAVLALLVARQERP